mmetsp:Transcript_24979/g.28784  ORF Transcript_24979/g.28784 Transcript_24979/m.28784 type:complete len:971 (-) Transcript_24979:236-3148(-)|eukprot:CAMPEP_0194371130 /NCGR_PEP_ID=MMETSP0174-20130528/19504_1 /TAXON_ID=216777 /ORGANISM="Proboscia alata, Strain PI-D3" /LENGTH=970 /DNA_ID=CAMNT_0039148997 /DNA_START=116 /DNA_END=3028 /DNA_ORIENTATION=+
MAKKKGGKKKGVQKAAVADNDDFDSILAESTTPATTAAAEDTPANKDTPAPSPAVEEKAPPKLDAAAAFLAAQGGGTASTEKKETKKKKKKKKGGGGGGGDDNKADEKVSARGRMVAERLAKQKAEEDRIAAEEAALQAEYEAEGRAEEERLRKIQEEKDRKKQKQKDKVERQKKEGTYMTKKQKEKARLAAQRLEAMKAAGMVPVVTKKKKEPEPEPEPEPEVQEEEVEEEANEKEEEEEDGEKEDDEPKEEEEDEESLPDWDASSDEDDDDKFNVLEARLQNITVKEDSDGEEEDLIAAEKKKENERLRKLGIEREKREKAEAALRAQLDNDEAEATRQQQLLAARKEEGKRKRLQQEKDNLAARTRDDLRCPVVVIMGHVDTGKTKLLDKIRKTNVQEGEAGGITQQIGATFFEKSTLITQTARLNETENFTFNIPGMLVIDTPGHESFTNLRSRGSSLCDVAILVVDLMHGLEQQTKESLNMLLKRGTPFVVALNKIDRCYAWKTCKDAPIREALEGQEEGTVGEFRTRATEAKIQLQELGVNSNLYWEMGDDDWSNSDFVPLVPTSAITGEGVQDILLLLCQIAQRKLWRNLMFCANLQATVLEVKAIDGLGMTVDVLVLNGYVKEGDTAIFCSLDGPVVTEIRGLLTPPPSREMRVKSDYIHHKQVKGALGVKIIGNGLDKVMAGTPMMICGEYDEEEDIKEEVMSDLSKLTNKLNTDSKGVMVQASTLGALEALLQFLREDTKPPIPVSAIGIGTIHKRDVTKISIMNERGVSEYATILAFDVKVEPDARDHAREMGVRIFTADIIYHLFDQFTRFMEELSETRREEAAAIAVFPSICRILPQHIFNQKDPIIVGIEVAEGILKIGTPLCIPALEGLYIGKVTSIEMNGKQQDTARKGASVAVKIENEHNPTLTYGRQFDSTNSLYSQVTRASIDALKTNFKDKLENEDWRLVVKLKKVFGII